jgi:hypothetical protein
VRKLETPRCMHCGERSEVELTETEFAAVTDPNGPLIQDALPGRDAGFRELVKTGIHPRCWDAMMTGPEDAE